MSFWNYCRGPPSLCPHNIPEKSHTLSSALHKGLAQAKAQSTMQAVIIRHKVLEMSHRQGPPSPLPRANKVTLREAGRTITIGDLRPECTTWVATMQLRGFSGVVTIWSLALRIDKTHSDSPGTLAAQEGSQRECRSPPYQSHKNPMARSSFQNFSPFPQHFSQKRHSKAAFSQRIPTPSAPRGAATNTL